MIYYRCKCGNSTSYGSMPPSPCCGCSECGTTLDTTPAFHSVPEPHDFITEYDRKTGEPYKRCRNCCQTEKEILTDINTD